MATEHGIVVGPDTPDKLRSFEQITVAGVVQTEAVALADPNDINAVMKITNATPAPTDYGLVVRVIGSASGGLTNAELRASPVPVSGPLTDTQLRASAVPVSNTVLSVVGGGPQATAQRVTLSDESVSALGGTTTAFFSYNSYLVAPGESVIPSGRMRHLRAFAVNADALLQINSGDLIRVRQGTGFDLTPVGFIGTPTISCNGASAGSLDIFVENST